MVKGLKTGFKTLAEFSSGWKPIRRRVQKIFRFFGEGRIVLRCVVVEGAATRFEEGPTRGDYVRN